MRGNSRSVVARVLVAMVFVAACGSSSSGPATLEDYASGRWSCTFRVHGAPGAVPPYMVTAVVSATSAPGGRVQLDDVVPAALAGRAIPSKMSGAWSLRNGQLVVTWDDKSEGTVHAEPISLGTKQFKIRGDNPIQPGQWATVNVDRQARSVSFAIAMPGLGSGKIACAKT
jgi:hypothetical protein